jgi:hypothetical protein
LAECINHPGKEGIYRCARCKKHFCLACVELIDDKAYCYDCLKEIVKEVREESRKSLTLMILGASLLALLLATVNLRDAYLKVTSHDSNMLLGYAPFYAYNLVIGVAFLVLSFGLAVTEKWSYRYGITLTVITLVVELLMAMNTQGGIEFFVSNPLSNLSLLYGIMILGPLFILIILFESRRELGG